MPGGYLKNTTTPGTRSKMSTVKFSSGATKATRRYAPPIQKPMFKAKLKKMKRPSTGAASMSLQKAGGLSTMSDIIDDYRMD